MRREIGWVTLARVLGYVQTFVLLKVLSSALGKEGYGEYGLARTALVLLAAVVTLPMQRTYIRYYHTAQERGEEHSVALYTIRWFAIGSLAVLLLGFGLTGWCASWANLGTWTVAAAGFVFVANRWRMLGTELYNIRRDRRAFAFHEGGFHLACTICIPAIVLLVSPTVTATLTTLGVVALLFCLIGVLPLLRGVLARASTNAAPIGKLVLTFGLPFGALQLLQWVQGFSDRYIVAWQLDLASVGVYVAAYQVCGVPYMFLVNIFDAMLKPLVYQRARDVTDPRQLWAADKVLLFGILGYAVSGAVLLIGYAFLGPRLLVLLTDEGFLLPGATVLILALGRYVQSLTFLLQMFFESHQTMTRSLGFRLVGACFTVPAVWLALTLSPNIEGAALGFCAAAVLYVGLLVIGPGGTMWLVLQSHSQASRLTAESKESSGAARGD